MKRASVLCATIKQRSHRTYPLFLTLTFASGIDFADEAGNPGLPESLVHRTRTGKACFRGKSSDSDEKETEFSHILL